MKRIKREYIPWEKKSVRKRKSREKERRRKNRSHLSDCYHLLCHWRSLRRSPDHVFFLPHHMDFLRNSDSLLPSDANRGGRRSGSSGKERTERTSGRKESGKKRTRRASGEKTSDERNRKRISAKNFQRISTEIFKTRRTTVQTAALLIFISYF